MFPVMCTIIVLQLYYNRVFLAESDEQVMIAQQAQAIHSPFIKLIVHNFNTTSRTGISCCMTQYVYCPCEPAARPLSSASPCSYSKQFLQAKVQSKAES